MTQNVLTLRPSKIQFRWVCFFIRTDLGKKCSISSLAYQWILCSEWVPSEWESKQLIKVSQYSTGNPHVSSPSINILWSKNPSIIHNNVSSSEKFHPLLSSYIKIHQHICLELTWNVFAWKHFWTFLAWSVHISLLVQIAQMPIFYWGKQYYGQRLKTSCFICFCKQADFHFTRC